MMHWYGLDIVILVSQVALAPEAIITASFLTFFLFFLLTILNYILVVQFIESSPL